MIPMQNRNWRTAIQAFWKRNSHFSALLELGLLFLPAIPAYLWMWPVLEPDTPLTNVVQSLVYVYLLVGAAWIGRRRWGWTELGLARHGLRPSVIGGIGLVGVLVLGRLALDIPAQPFPPPGFWELAWDVVFYFAFVGLTEEFIFRGVLWHALEGLWGKVAALLLTSLTFGIYHIGWANPLQMVVLVVVGLFLGLIRLRAGSILGLVLLHGLFDVLSINLFHGIDRTSITIEMVVNRTPVIMADVLFFGTLAYLLFPGVFSKLFKRIGLGG